MKIRIHITKKVLEETKFCGIDSKTTGLVGSNCAIGKEITRLLPTAWVGTAKIYIYKTIPNLHLVNSTSDCEEIQLPKEAVKFIEEFDALGSDARTKMTPIFFDIDVPDSVIEKIGIEEATRILSSSKTLELI